MMPEFGIAMQAIWPQAGSPLHLLWFAIISHVTLKDILYTKSLVTLLSAAEFNKIVKVKDSFITLDQYLLKTIKFC